MGDILIGQQYIIQQYYNLQNYQSLILLLIIIIYQSDINIDELCV